jgi:TRAP transporter TAXI family solute receptor
MQTSRAISGNLASGRERADTSLRMGVTRRDCLTALALLGPACSRAGHTRKRRLSIAAGLTGGVYYVYGGGIAKVESEALPDVELTAEATSGSIDNLKFVTSGRADIGFTMADTLDDAVKGQGAFREGGPLRLRSLAALIDNYTHVATFAKSGLRSLADLRGRVVSVGAPGSGTETIALRILEAAGIDPASGIRRQGLGVNASVDALKDGKLDAFFWSSGVPAGSILDLAATPGQKLMLIPSDSVLPELQRRFPGLYENGKVARDAYPGLDADVPVVTVKSLLAVGESMDEELAYRLTRTLFEKQEALAAIHPEARHLSLDAATRGSTAPFHAGAIRYYRERGAWRS